MPDYSTLITAAGQAAFANAIALATPVNITSMAVGDSNGVGYDPDENQTDLVNELYESAAIDVTVEAGGILAVEMTIPIDQGGWHIREAAVKADDGTILAIMRYPDSYKPLPSATIASEKMITMKLNVGNTNAVSWVIDPSSLQHIARQLRPDFRSVNNVSGVDQDNPPDPSIAGDTWIVGPAPTAAWAGKANQLAEWSGTGWVFAEPTPWMLVGLADRTDKRWDHTLTTWVDPLATAADVLSGLDPRKLITPAAMAGVLGASFASMEFHFMGNSGNFAAPVGAVGGIVIVTGGGGAGARHFDPIAGGGMAGSSAMGWVPYSGGDIIPVTIGLGGLGRSISSVGLPGSPTFFGDFLKAAGGEGGTVDGNSAGDAQGLTGTAVAEGTVPFIPIRGGAGFQLGSGGPSFWGGPNARGGGGHYSHNGTGDSGIDGCVAVLSMINLEE